MLVVARCSAAHCCAKAWSTILLWGRPHPKPGGSLKDTTLTQFAPEVWTGLYAPLFMFDGSWSLEYNESERLYRVKLGALFRNALDPGQYPYPFWHDAKEMERLPEGQHRGALDCATVGQHRGGPIRQ